MLLSKDDELQSTSKLLKDKVCIMYIELYVYFGTVGICLYVCVCTYMYCIASNYGPGIYFFPAIFNYVGY